MTIGHHRFYYINSANRLYGTTSRFTTNILYYERDNFDRVAVVQAVIPKSYYLIRAGLNSFTLTENLNTVIITIPVGNYTRRSLQDTLQNLLNNNSPNNITYIITWPGSIQPNTGKFTFTCSDVGGIQPQFTFTNSLAYRLGFDDNTTVQFNNFTLESTNVINLQAEDLLYLHSNIGNNGNDDVLQEIYSSAGSPDYSNIHYINPDIEIYSKELVSKTKTDYYFLLTDKEGVEINLNGVDIVFTLVLFTSNKIYQQISEYIKYKVHHDDEIEEENKKQNQKLDTILNNLIKL